MLSDKVWVTRKTRIHTEERLLAYSNISQVLMIWYSLVLVYLSILNLQTNDLRLNQLSAFASIVVLVLSVQITAQKFTERSIAMRNCYIKLDELYSKVKRAEQADDREMLQHLESEYTGLLINIENHSEYDYLCLRYSLRGDPNTTLPPFTKLDLARYLSERFWRGLLIAIFFAVPIIFWVLI